MLPIPPTQSQQTPSRRDFLRWSAAAIAALHAPWLSAQTPATTPASASANIQLRHTRLRARDLAAQAAFYRDVLKLPIETSDRALRVTAGDSVLEFVPAEAGTRPFYHFAFTIPENKLNEALAWLEPRCPILNIRNTPEKIMDFKSWNAQSFYYNDPENNILEFIVHHDLANPATDPFNEKQILWQSEIGLVVPDVPAAEKQIADALGLHYYRDHSPNFSAIGDLRGQLIVVKKDRIWLPTLDVHADVFPTEVEVAGAMRGTLNLNGAPYSVSVK